jgi:ankyrin repeat protein
MSDKTSSPPATPENGVGTGAGAASQATPRFAAKPLPPAPNLEQLKKQARELQRAFESGDAQARQRVGQHVPRVLAAQVPSSANLKLSKAYFVLAREHGFPSWLRFKEYVARINSARASSQRPFSTDISYFEDRAHGLLRTQQDGLPSSLQQIKEFHPRFASASDDEVRAAQFSQDDARLVLAREHGFDSWSELERHINSLSTGRTVEPFMSAFQALKEGDITRFETILQQDPTLLNARGTNGNTLLNLAASLKQLDAVRILIEAGTDVNIGNRYGWTALHQAGYANMPELAEVLLQAGASPQLSARGDGGTPLVQALFWGHAATADTLAAHGIYPLNLRVAAGLGRVDLLQEMFDAEGELTPQAGAQRDYYRPHPGFMSWTPSDDAQEITDEAFVYAAKCGRIDALDFLLQHGANVNAEPYNGTALHWACSTGQLTTVAWLLDRGADIQSLSKFGGEAGLSALHIAAWSGKTEVARLLLQRGADVTLREKRYWATPLDWADFNGRTATRDFLLAHGEHDVLDCVRFNLLDSVRSQLEADPSLANRFVFEPPVDIDVHAATPLLIFQAIWAGHREMLQLLLERGADPNPQWKENGKSPLQLAQEQGKDDLVQLLRQHGAK